MSGRHYHPRRHRVRARGAHHERLGALPDLPLTEQGRAMWGTDHHAEHGDDQTPDADQAPVTRTEHTP